ncbi:hypothetical protein GCM10022220_57690 [Actinocatenispora rupis]|uniref:FHA domain-containing protein n=1 Tax=Actinocatenispora rupis TaxID=519421 RepID=A0A8J3JDI9_9ACTN|nr:hypothetical protein Aru02nite_53760 [Actinocatenispora rupis]
MHNVRRSSGHALRAGHDSLALGVPESVPGTIFALAVTGGIEMRPREGRTILFGRNSDDVHVCVGADDRGVSRQHGVLLCEDNRWWVRNTGRLPIRLPGSRLLFHGEDPVPLTAGYSPLFVRGARNRDHLLEVYVASTAGDRPTARHLDPTQPPRLWRLAPDERAVLTVLGQRYLRHEAHPQPLTWRQTAEALAELFPAAGWTAKRVEHHVVAVRTRLSRDGVAGLTREEVGEPVGNALNDNLLRELMLSTTLIPPDLALLDHP